MEDIALNRDRMLHGRYSAEQRSDVSTSRDKSEEEMESKLLLVQSGTARIPNYQKEQIPLDARKSLEVNSIVVENLRDHVRSGDTSTELVNSAQTAILNFYKNHEIWIWRLIYSVLLVLYFAYFGYAMYFRLGDEGSYRLIVGTVFAVFLIVVNSFWEYFSAPFQRIYDFLSRSDLQTKLKLVRWIFYIACCITILVILVVEVVIPSPENLTSLAGLAAFVLICYVTSTNPAKVDWHPIFWSFALQFFFAAIILKTTVGYGAFKWLGDRVTEFLAYTDYGSRFVFNDIGAHNFATAIMPVIAFFTSFISIMYYLGVMQAIVRVIGRFLAFCLGTTPAESLSAAASIFLAVSANHLLAATFMSAPAGLAISKLMCPETEETKWSVDDYRNLQKGEHRNLIDAASAGATMSVTIIASIIVNLIAFLAFLAFINATLTWFGDRVGIEGFTFEFICSYLLYPVALFMGTKPQDCRRVAELVGIKTFTNEFIAYQSLKELLDNRKSWLNYTEVYNNTAESWHWNGQDAVLTHWNNYTLKRGFLSPRSEVIATYALCGFSNIGSMGIALGILTPLIRRRKAEISQIIVRTMIAGSIACFVIACIAGLFFTEFDS